jgi:hypothetical protein
VPGVASLEDLRRAIEDFPVTDFDVEFEASAEQDIRRSLNASGLILLGEMHGVHENPLIIGALMRQLGLHGLALEWPEELAPLVDSFLACGALDDHAFLWSGDGRITVGHFAVLRDLAAHGQLRLTLFDGNVDAAWTWSRRDETMAHRLLAATTRDEGMLVVAGNLHTGRTEIELGAPMGAVLARHRPEVRDIGIRYGGGGFYNFGPCRFTPCSKEQTRPRLHRNGEDLVLDLARGTEALVPHRAEGVTSHPSGSRTDP